MYAFVLGSLGSVNMVSVRPCSISSIAQIEKDDVVEESISCYDRHVS
jgi:hypothetical protein